jgi:capsular exopolysaccharide synthesis family protein
VEPGERERLRLLAGRSEREGLAYLRGAVQTEVDVRDDSLMISVDASDADGAAELVNAVVRNYIEYRLRESRYAVDDMLRILQKEKTACDTERAQKLDAMAEFRRAHPNVAVGTTASEKLSFLSASLLQARWATIDMQSLYESATRMRDDPQQLKQLVATNGDKGLAMPLSDEMAELRRDLREAQRHAAGLASAGILPNNERRKGAEAEVQALQQMVPQIERQSAEQLLEILGQRVAQAKRKEASIQAELGEEQNRTSSGNKEGAQYAILESDLRRTERLSDMIDARMKQLQIGQRASDAGVTVMEAAEASRTPISPRRWTVLGLASGIGLVLGFACALALEWGDPRYRSIGEIRSAFQFPLLGVVPHFRLDAEEGRIEQAVHVVPRSDMAESFRSIRTAVLFGASSSGIRTILVTSPTPGDGKTVVASNLAIALAQGGLRTVLIDADFHRPRQHEVFNVDGRRGLSDHLQGDAELREVLLQTGLKRLHIIPSGPMPIDPSRLLGGKTFSSLLKRLSEGYQMIVIDSPPALVVTDACVLGALCNATLLVLRAGRSTRHDGESAVERLLSVGSFLLGVVANDVRAQVGGYRYYYRAQRALPAGAAAAVGVGAGVGTGVADGSKSIDESPGSLDGPV